MLVTGMAVVTSVAAANNLYQSKKAYEARRQAVRAGKEGKKGGMSREEAMIARRKGLMADLVALGVGAVCLNNARKGWMRVKGLDK